MKLLSYHGTRSGIMGLGNIAIRLRLRGKMSHSEVMFEPGDNVDHLMPDGTCEPDASGAYWCVSSVGLERMPAWSLYRAGRLGGVRFKRIVPDTAKWTPRKTPADPFRAAQWAKGAQGVLYDWQLIFSFLFWVIPNKKSRGMCSEVCATMLGYDEAWRFDPCNLDVVVRGNLW